MTTPTLPQAAQMAEDTLAALWDRHAGGKLNIDSACPAFIDRAQKTITALRAALAQSAAPAVPNGAYPECSGDPNSCPENEGHGCCRESTAPAVPDDIAAIIACLGDDAALLRETTDDSEEIAQNMDDAAAALERLSAAPAVREPLTQDQIVGLAENYEERYHRWVFICVDELEQFARAIEKAHGIGTTGGGNG